MAVVKLTPGTNLEAEAKRVQGEQKRGWTLMERIKFGLKGKTPEEQREFDVAKQNQGGGEHKG